MKAPTYNIQRIKESLPPLSQLFTRDGFPVRRSGSAMFACCPFHEEKTPSCQVDDTSARYHCFGCGAGGDAIDYLQKTWGTSFQDTLERLAASHGIVPDSGYTAPRKPATPKPEEPIGPMDSQQLDRWHQACERLLHAEGEIQRIADWRGIDPECVRWSAARGLMGSYIWWDLPREAFLVEMPTATGRLPVSVHIRLAPHSKGHPRPDDPKPSWNFDPKKRGAWPFVIGDPATADFIFLLEGQWDALALVSMMGWHRREKWPSIAIFGLRGASGGGKLLAHPFNPRARLFAVADADGAGAGWFEEGGLLDKLHAKVRDVIGFWPTTAKQDLNDLVKSGSLTRDAFMHHLAPLMPLRKGRGPTFLQWSKGNATATDALGRAARYVLRDITRPKGRRPLRDWERHWRKTSVPEDLYADLCLAWRQHLTPAPAAAAPDLPLLPTT